MQIITSFRNYTKSTKDNQAQFAEIELSQKVVSPRLMNTLKNPRISARPLEMTKCNHAVCIYRIE